MFKKVLFLLIISGSLLNAGNIYYDSINDPFFDGRMAGVQVTLVENSHLFGWYNKEKPIKRYLSQVNVTIIGRYLFPNLQKEATAVWWYFIRTPDNQHYWIKNSDFTFTDLSFKEGVYTFRWVPRNRKYPRLNGRELEMQLYREGDKILLSLGKTNGDSFEALTRAEAINNGDKNYLHFHFLNYVVLFPKYPERIYPFVHIQNPEQGRPNVPELFYKSPPLKVDNKKIVTGETESPR